MARITLCRASDFYKYQPKKEEKELTSAQLVQPTLLVLPNGNKITTEGIPTPQKEYLERLLQTPLKQADMRLKYILIMLLSYKNLYFYYFNDLLCKDLYFILI